MEDFSEPEPLRPIEETMARPRSGKCRCGRLDFCAGANLRHEGPFEGYVSFMVNHNCDGIGGNVKSIFSYTDKYVIYAVFDQYSIGNVRFYLNEPYEESRETRSRILPLYGSISYITDIANQLRERRLLRLPMEPDVLCSEMRLLELVAKAIQMAIENNPSGAQAILTRTVAELEGRRDSRNRMRYVGASAFATVLTLVLWFFLDKDMYGFGLPSLAAVKQSASLVGGLGGTPEVVDVLALGALGAFFSISAGIRNISVRYSITTWEMFYTGFSRILIGVIAAAVVVLLISGRMMLSSVESDVQSWAFLLFGFVAGFSEMFIPNALNTLEGKTTVALPT